MNRIPGILRVGIGVGAGADADAGISAGVLAETVHRYQAEVAVPKSVHMAPYRVLHSPSINSGVGRGYR